MKLARWSQRKSSTPWAWPTLILAGIASAGFALMHADTAMALGQRWNEDPNSSHGYLVLLFAGLLAGQNLGDMRQKSATEAGAERLNQGEPGGGVLLGVILLTTALLLRIITAIVASLVAESLALLLALAGITLLVGGGRHWHVLRGPIGFLLFLIPWPAHWASALTQHLQLWVSSFAAGTLQLLGLTVWREGNLIRLPIVDLHVAETCSGLRQLTAFLALGACLACWLRRPLVIRGLVMGSAIPIAVLCNVARVVGTALVVEYLGASWIEGWLHDVEGLIMMGGGLVLYLAEVAFLDWLATPTAPPVEPQRSPVAVGMG